jgi:VanZ family protein
MPNAGEASKPSPRDPVISLGRGSLAWPVTLAVTILIASGRPMTGAPFLFPHADKVIHFFMFGLLATLVVRAGPIWCRGPWRGWIAILAVSTFGILDEFRQSFTPGRFVEIADWVADTSGASVAVCTYLFWDRYRALLEMPLWTRKRDLPSTAKGSR